MPKVNGVFTEPNNKNRASWANIALDAYAKETQGGPVHERRVTVDDPSDPESRDHAEEVMSDLLGDLQHLAMAWGIDFEEQLDRANRHFAAEVAEEEL
jgi:hypothetical protein